MHNQPQPEGVYRIYVLKIKPTVQSGHEIILSLRDESRTWKDVARVVAPNWVFGKEMIANYENDLRDAFIETDPQWIPRYTLKNGTAKTN